MNNVNTICKHCTQKKAELPQALPVCFLDMKFP